LKKAENVCYPSSRAGGKTRGIIKIILWKSRDTASFKICGLIIPHLHDYKCLANNGKHPGGLQEIFILGHNAKEGPKVNPGENHSQNMLRFSAQ
jgi:hypothetical protein